MKIHLDRVDSRGRLPIRRDPYWHRLSEGRYVGFRRMTPGTPGTWLARIYDGDRYQHRSLGDFVTLSEKERFDAAKKASEEWFSHLDLGGAADPGTVKAACEAYVSHLRRESSERAAHDAELRFKMLVYGDEKRAAVPDPIARVELSKLSKVHVGAWRERVLKRGGSKGTFNRNATALRAALNLAKADGKVPSDQAWVEKLKPFEGADGRRVLYLDSAERAKLIENASKELQPFLNVLRLLPLRPGDVANLKVEHFDERQKVLNVPQGKTGARMVPLSSDAAALFKGCAKNKLPAAWLVARANGDQWKKEAWRDAIKEAAAAAKLPSATVAYTMRHSVITDLVTNGLDLFTVAQISGTSVAMIEKHYGKLRQVHARAALELLSKA